MRSATLEVAIEGRHSTPARAVFWVVFRRWYRFRMLVLQKVNDGACSLELNHCCTTLRDLEVFLLAWL